MYNVLKLSYGHIMKIHTVLAAHSEQFPFVDESLFIQFAKKGGMISNLFRIKDAIELFNLASGNERFLNRPQFLKLIIMMV